MAAAGDSAPRVRVQVEGLPTWLDARRLLDSPGLQLSAGPDGRCRAQGVLPPREAADLAARLRGVGLDGRLLSVQVEPALPRALIRAARTVDARRRRATSVGFSRTGARLDVQGRYSLTPEALALRMGEAAAAAGLLRVLDAGAGAGGNAIGFARAGCQVMAVEQDAARLALCRHNARVYGVQGSIRCACGDALQAASGDEGRAAQLWFVDPPWGPHWNRERTGLSDFPLLASLAALPGRPPLWAKLPPSFEVAQLPGAVPTALFGEGEGDRSRVKCVWVRLP